MIRTTSLPRSPGARLTWPTFILSLACLGTLAAVVRGQDSEPRPPMPTPADVAAAEGEAPTPLREQSIYIPYARLRSLFEKEGRGVFIPYEKFQELWNAARAAAKKIEDVQPPIGALISEIDSVAVISDRADVVEVTATIKLEVLQEGWNEIPLRLRGAAIRSAKLGDEPARLLHDANTGYKLLFEKKGEGGGATDAQAGLCPRVRQIAGIQQRAVRRAAGPRQPLGNSRLPVRGEGQRASQAFRHRKFGGDGEREAGGQAGNRRRSLRRCSRCGENRLDAEG